MKGLRNIGNTCYLNSGLQMLINNKDLCDLIKKKAEDSIILNKICNFIDLYNDSESSDVIVPHEIKKIVQEKQEIFIGYNQHDSTEFIIYLLDIIDEEIKKSDSLGISSLFNIEMNTRIKCKIRDCLQIYNKKEYNNFLLLDIDTNCKSLDDAYRIFKSGEKLDDDNKYYCEKCKTKRIASKRSTIEKWPKYTFIWLKRFRQNGNKIMKNNQDLDIPLEWRHNNKWYLYNDSNVSEINSESELLRLLAKAYWLCYKSD